MASNENGKVPGREEGVLMKLWSERKLNEVWDGRTGGCTQRPSGNGVASSGMQEMFQ